ncbi:hypothetical protein [Heliophilum fasciatum]|uniref:Lipoprotein n=1 Tax=Heliophilum fasciatum TaxID=35700 RepID=A0A4V2SY45_9FIRM|nr:hypothetical protein [Heliophilum fasciatum]MCW2276934.1 hypothetical protein [Heliophilum fasciatum]TCP68606.1 hypothetical protein EDD73_1021 [Heliophilum fasciatum]
MIKRIIIAIFSLTLATCFLIGCSKTATVYSPKANSITMDATQVSTIQSNSEQQRKTAFTTDLLKLIDDKFISRYIKDLDICVPELIFANSEDIPSQTLYTFSIYVMDMEYHFTHGDIEDSGDKFLNKGDNKYHIPVKTIREVLDKYFEKTRFKPEKVYAFEPVKNEFVTPIFAGFGGDRKVELSNKEQISDDTVRLIVDFLVPESGEIYCTKVFTMKYTSNSWKYLSVTKNYDKSDTEKRFPKIRWFRQHKS